MSLTADEPLEADAGRNFCAVQHLWIVDRERTRPCQT